MGNVPQVNHQRVVRALERAGYKIIRQGKHIIMSDGKTALTIPRNNPIKTTTLKQILESANITLEQFKELL